MELVVKKSRILGLAFLIQFLSSFASGIFILPMATGVPGLGASVDIGRIMARIAQNPALVRLDIVMELVTAAGVIFLGATLFATLRKHGEGLALTAFGLYVLEAVLIAISRLALFALLVTSQNPSAAGNPESTLSAARLMWESLGYAFKMANFAFCVGGTIFYALLLKARSVARPMALWGLVGTQGVFAGLLLGLFGLTPPIFLYIPYIPFELAIAVWIIARGVEKETVK